MQAGKGEINRGVGVVPGTVGVELLNFGALDFHLFVVRCAATVMRFQIVELFTVGDLAAVELDGAGPGAVLHFERSGNKVAIGDLPVVQGDFVVGKLVVIFV